MNKDKQKVRKVIELIASDDMSEKTYKHLSRALYVTLNNDELSFHYKNVEEVIIVDEILADEISNII